MNLNSLLNDELMVTPSIEVKEKSNGKVVLITGAAGSIGEAITKVFSELENCKLILMDIAESALYDLQQDLILDGKNNFEIVVGDVTDKKFIEQLFKKFQPNWVYHIAAYKHVPLMEKNPYEAIKVNVQGTKIVADCSLNNNVESFVLVSTDKAVYPTSIMGATKRISELYISNLNTDLKGVFKFVRFGNVPNTHGSIIPLFKKQLEKRGVISITNSKMERYFISISNACDLLLKAIITNDCDLLIHQMNTAVNIKDLAIAFIKNEGDNYPEAVKIETIGIRPGEKLNEQVVYKNEMPDTTNLKSAIKKYSFDHSFMNMELINKLCFIDPSLPKGIILEKLKEIIPEFNPVRQNV